MSRYSAVPTGTPSIRFPCTETLDNYFTVASMKLVEWLKNLRCTNCPTMFSTTETPYCAPCGHLLCKRCTDSYVTGTDANSISTKCVTCGPVSYPRRPIEFVCKQHTVLKMLFEGLESTGYQCSSCPQIHGKYHTLQCITCDKLSCVHCAATQHRDHNLRLINKSDKSSVGRLSSLHATDCANAGAVLTQCASCGLLLNDHPFFSRTKTVHLLPCSHSVHFSCLRKNPVVCNFCNVEHKNLQDSLLQPRYVIDAIEEMNPSSKCVKCKKLFPNDFIFRPNHHQICLYCLIEHRSCTTG